MKEINGMKFDTSIRVLFTVKEKKGHKTLQETYAYVGDKDNMDHMIDILLISYNLANDIELDEKGFQGILANNGIGIIKMITIFGQVVEDLMFDGTSEDERKNIMALAEKERKK